MSTSKLTYELSSNKPAHAVKEEQIEFGFIGKLQDLKYEYRSDIRDRAALEFNFRQKFDALNRVKLSDGEFARLLDEIVSPDVFAAARMLRERNAFTRDDGTPLKLVSKLRFPEFRGAEGWNAAPLGELGAIVTGKTPSTKEVDLWGGEILFITPTDITEDEKYQHTTQRTVIESKGTKVLPPGSVV